MKPIIALLVTGVFSSLASIAFPQTDRQSPTKSSKGDPVKKMKNDVRLPFKSMKENLSYILGRQSAQVINNIEKQQGIAIDRKRYQEGFNDAVRGSKPRFTTAQKYHVLTEYNKRAAAARQAQLKKNNLIAAIRKLGARVSYDAMNPSKPLHVSFFSVTDAKLARIAELRDVHSLNLSRTKVTNAGIAHLSGLTHLHNLSLANTSIGNDALIHLKGLRSLEHLDLNGTIVTNPGIAQLKRLTNLRRLDMSGTVVSDAALVHLEGMTNLQRLHLDGTAVSPARVEKLKRRLPNCRISSDSLLWRGAESEEHSIATIRKFGGKVFFDPKHPFNNVVRIDLPVGAPAATDIGLARLHTPLKKLRHLQHLSIDGSKITDAGLIHLKDLMTLQHLELGRRSKITDTGLRHIIGLTNLRYLNVSGSNITKTGLFHLKGFARLRTLKVDRTKTSPLSVEQLEASLPNCRISSRELLWDGKKEEQQSIAAIRDFNGRVFFDTKGTYCVVAVELSNTNDNELALLQSHLMRLPKLRRLWLTGSGVTDAGLVHLKEMKTLQQLNLSSARISDAGLIHLKRLSDLKGVNVSYTKITNVGLLHLNGLTIQSLDLRGTAVTNAGLSYLKGFKHLRRLDLSYTRVNGAGLVHLKGMANAHKLDLTLSTLDSASLKRLPEFPLLKPMAQGGGRLGFGATRSRELYHLISARHTSGMAFDDLQHATRECLNDSDFSVSGFNITGTFRGQPYLNFYYGAVSGLPIVTDGLEDLVRMEYVRRGVFKNVDHGDFRVHSFWEPILKRAEHNHRIRHNMLRRFYKKEIDFDAYLVQMQKHPLFIDLCYEVIRKYSLRNGLRLHYEPFFTRIRPAPGRPYVVSIRTVPPGASVFLVGALSYRIAVKRGKTPRWSEVVTGSAPLIGAYFYHLKLRDGTVTKPKRVVVRGAEQITFTK